MPAIRTKSQLATAASPAAFPVSPAATTTWLSAALGALAALALAVPAGAQTMHRSPHEEETANIVGLKGGFVSTFREGRSAVGGGLSPFYERNVIPGWLELEAALTFAWVEDETVIGFDLFAKKPFHVNESVNPYVGLGPNVSILISPEKTITRFGILATAGSYFWFRESPWGLDLEVVYLLLFDSDLVHELTVEFGPVFRF